MYKIQMTDENILVQKVQTKAASQFETGGEDTDKRGAVYCVKHSPEKCSYKAESLVMLKPGQYPGFYFEDEVFTVIEESDVIATVTETKKK